VNRLIPIAKPANRQSKARPRLAPALLGLSLCLVWLSGCGYSAKELYPEEYQTVAVPIFENRTFYREFEFALSEALVKQLESRTPYKVASPGTADTMLSGAITEVEQNTFSRTPEAGLPQQQELRVVVNFEWRDLDTGRTLRSRRGFEAVSRYAPTRPVSDPLETARHRAVEDLARSIVSTMQAGFGEPAANPPRTGPDAAATQPAASDVSPQGR
jgi:hypothetical protein